MKNTSKFLSIQIILFSPSQIIVGQARSSSMPVKLGKKKYEKFSDDIKL